MSAARCGTLSSYAVGRYLLTTVRWPRQWPRQYATLLLRAFPVALTCPGQGQLLSSIMPGGWLLRPVSTPIP